MATGLAAAGLALVAVVALFLLFGRNRQVVARKEAARFLGVRYRSSGLFDSTMLSVSRLEGLLDGFPLQVDFFGPGAHTDFFLKGVTRGLVLRRRQSPLPRVKEAAVATGDPLFDLAYDLAGSADVVLAQLDQDSRAVFVKAASRLTDLQVEDGMLRSRSESGAELDADAIISKTKLLVELADHLRTRDSPKLERLLINATQDVLPLVRQRNLEALLATHPQAPETRTACQLTLSAGTGIAAVKAARGLGSDGWLALEGYALDEAHPMTVRLEAFQALETTLPNESLVRLATRLTGASRSMLRARAIAVLGRCAARELLPRIVELSRSAEDAEEACAIALAFGQFADPAAETALLALLQHDAMSARVAAAAALGRCGSAAALPPLRANVGNGVITSALERSLASTSAMSISEIQARLKAGPPA
jgi:hypothetical protein